MARWKMLLLFCFVSIWSGGAFASGADELRSIVRASSVSHLSSIVQEAKKLRVARVACETQLKSEAVPFSCFEVIAIKEGGRLYEERWLEALCLERVKRATQRHSLKAALSSSRLPVECHKALIKRVDDLEYAAQGERPYEFFSENHRQ